MGHKALALTFPGMTHVCAAEIQALVKSSTREIGEGVLFDAKPEDLLVLCYRGQSISRLLLLVSEGTLEELSVPKEYLKGTISFTGKRSTKAQQLAERIQANKVYKNADVPFYLHFEDDYYWLGIDLGDDLSKRDYRIFVGSEVLKGVTAFAALQLAGYEAKHTILDPFCRAGSIIIEAALSALQMPVRYYSKDKLAKMFKDTDTENVFKEQDKNIKETIPGKITALSAQFPQVQAARKNAKIAGVVKTIDFSRIELEWIDTKFEKQSIDRIVTQPIEFVTTFPPEKAKRIASLFFERASAILKKNGTICLVLRQGKDTYLEAVKTQNYSLEHERTIMQGKEAWNVLVFTKPS